VKGEDNVVADAFSRLCVLQTLEEELETADSKVSEESSLILVPIPGRKYQILKRFHNDLCGHHGVNRMIELLRENNHDWEKMKEQVKQFVQRCPCCQKNDQRRTAVVGRPFTLSTADPMRKIYVDLIENLREDTEGNKHILVLIDAFSRFVMMYPIKEKTALAVAKAMFQMIGDYGAPKELVSDRGPCFVNDILDSLLTLLGTDHQLTLAYSKEENGMVERANKEIMRHLRNIIFDRNVISQWSTYLPLVKRIFNSSVHSITKVAPAKVIFGGAIDLNANMFDQQNGTDSSQLIYMDSWVRTLKEGQEMISAIVRRNLQEQKEKHLAKKSQANYTEFGVGTLVLVEHVNQLRRGPQSKLLPFLKGPYKVLSVDRDRYTLRNLITMREKDYHVKRLHKYLYDPQTLNPTMVACKDSGEQFLVESIQSIRGRIEGKKEQLQFLVKWIGYDTPTWEPWKNIRHTIALYNFLLNHKDQKLKKINSKKY
jgi:hypothetical protein